MNTLTDFIQEELKPTLINYIDRAFPTMEFKRKGYRWSSPYHLDGTPSKTGAKERCYINPNGRYPYRVGATDNDGSLDLIEFALQYDGYNPKAHTTEQLIATLKRLCSVCGLELPTMQDSESYKAYKEKQDKLTAIATKMAKALYTDEAKPVLSYLKDSRGYDDGFIKDAGLGYINAATAKELSTILTDNFPFGVGDTYRLAIPYVTGGNVKGFVFRRIDGEQPKYKDAFISASETKRYHLFGLTGLKLTGKEERDRDITVVEGELDALRASYAGVKNVVAASGGEISKEALAEAKRRGVKMVTLLFDTEDSTASQEKNYKKAAKAIRTIQENGLTAFVCYLPSQPGQKQDADSYLKNHTGEDMEKEIAKAQSGSVWLYSRLWSNFYNAAKQAEEAGAASVPSKLLDEFKRNTIDLCNDGTLTTPTDRRVILRSFAEATGNYITESDLQEEADNAKAIQDAAKQDIEATNLLGKASRLIKDGKKDEAFTLLQDELPNVKAISTENEFNKLLTLPTANDLQEWVTNKPVGIPTAYSFGTGDKEEQLIIPSGALTFIAAPTSHGKSTMLRNLTLQMAKANNDRGAIVYFTFEEDKGSVFEELENTYIGAELSRNNLKTIHYYHATGGKELSISSLSNVSRDGFKAKEKEFAKLFEDGRIRLFDVEFGSKKLTEFIRYLNKHIKVQAVCVDYIQFLRQEGANQKRLQRNEELKAIGDDLNTLAKDTGLPVILAAQLNRDAKSPVEMHNQNIADAADIERIANTVILLWNSTFLPTNGSVWVTDKQNTDGSPKKQAKPQEQVELESRGFILNRHPQPGEAKIYALLSKNRGGTVGLDAVFDFDGNTGTIRGNYKAKPQQGELPLNSSSKEEDLLEDDTPF